MTPAKVPSWERFWTCLSLDFFLFPLNFYLFIFNFWLHWVSTAARAFLYLRQFFYKLSDARPLFSTTAIDIHSVQIFCRSWRLLSFQCAGFSLWCLLLSWNTGCRLCGLQSLQHIWALGPRAQVYYLWCTGLVALRRLGSSQPGDWTHVSCIGWQISVLLGHQGNPVSVMFMKRIFEHEHVIVKTFKYQ